MKPILKDETVRDVAAFQLWLLHRGYVVEPAQGDYELLRWRAAGRDKPGILYTNKRGVIGQMNDQDAENDWLDWRVDVVEAAGTAVLPSQRPASTARVPEATPVSVQTPKPGKLPISDLLPAPGGFTLVRHDHAGYVGADVHDSQGRWVANIHGTNRGKPIAEYERNLALYTAAPRMEALLRQLATAGQNDLLIGPQTFAEIETLLKEIPCASHS